MFVQAYGKQALPWALGLTLIGVALLTYIYGRLLTILGPRHTLQVTTVLAIVTMLVSYAAIRAGLKPARIVLFIFKESYVVLLIEQIWSYIDSTLDPKAAKRLNGPICGAVSYTHLVNQVENRRRSRWDRHTLRVSRQPEGAARGYRSNSSPAWKNRLSSTAAASAESDA